MYFYVISGAILVPFFNYVLAFSIVSSSIVFASIFNQKTLNYEPPEPRKTLFFLNKKHSFRKIVLARKSLVLNRSVDHCWSISCQLWCHVRCFFGIDFCINLYVDFWIKIEPKATKMYPKIASNKSEKM